MGPRQVRPHGRGPLLRHHLSQVRPLEGERSEQGELELYVSNPSSDGGRFYRILDSSWTEGDRTGVGKTSVGGRVQWTDRRRHQWRRTLDANDKSPYVPDPALMVGEAQDGGQRGLAPTKSTLSRTRSRTAQGFTLAVMNGSSNGTTLLQSRHQERGRATVLHVTRADGAPPSTPRCAGTTSARHPSSADGSADTACPGRMRPTAPALRPRPPPPPGRGFLMHLTPGTATTVSGQYTSRYSNRSMPASTKIDARAGRSSARRRTSTR